MSKRIVVLLHALGSDRTFWDLVFPRGLPEGYIAADLPGHGNRSKDEVPLDLSDFSQPVVRLLRELRRDSAEASIGVAGMSLGGLVAQHVAASNEALVDWAVLIDTVAVYPEAMRQNWRAREKAMTSGTPVDYLDATLGVWYTREFLSSDRGEQAAEHVRTTLTATPPQAYGRACRMLAEADASSLTQRISVPTLVVCGDKEGEAFLAAARAFMQHLPQAEALWLDGQHAAVVEDSNAFVTSLEEFAMKHAK